VVLLQAVTPSGQDGCMLHEAGRLASVSPGHSTQSLGSMLQLPPLQVVDLVQVGQLDRSPELSQVQVLLFTAASGTSLHVPLLQMVQQPKQSQPGGVIAEQSTQLASPAGPGSPQQSTPGVQSFLALPSQSPGGFPPVCAS
jgi:hypothetical protein